jgi:hypothetical protein
MLLWNIKNLKTFSGKSRPRLALVSCQPRSQSSPVRGCRGESQETVRKSFHTRQDSSNYYAI